ncbi:MAG: 50S ribosomal protein L11 methyltransferase [Burkholderiales bacterium]|nr:50S ribosomal protein L11 methyltransferase [Burkholderiales bacterium]
MDWLRVRLHVTADEAEALADAWLEQGALSVDVADARAGTMDEHPLFGEPGSEQGARWPDSILTALLPGDADALASVQAACEAAGLDGREALIDRLPEQDWVRLTQSQFEPIRVSDRLWIVPTWCEPPDPAAISLRLDPGLAFGTGSHPTTRLCLRWLDAHLRPGASVIDYGCGSGILAIAARRLGAGSVTGVDIDPNAVRASIANAAHNGVDATFVEPDAFHAPPADVVVANILSNPLRVLAPLIAGLARPGGAVVLSGILAAQAELVAAAYADRVALEPPIEDDGWICLWGRRR